MSTYNIYFYKNIYILGAFTEKKKTKKKTKAITIGA